MITAELIYSVPNLADTEKLFNHYQMPGRIVIVDRGKNPLHEKVFRIQAAGAVGILIADDGQCDEHFHFCGPRAGSVFEGGFAAHDGLEVWSSLSIPVYLVTQATATRLKGMMTLKELNILGMGLHNITMENGDKRAL